jgi:hypothetical protein
MIEQTNVVDLLDSEALSECLGRVSARQQPLPQGG